MLAHERLDRATQVANHLAAASLPGVVHLDKRIPGEQVRAFRHDINPGVTTISEHAADWGRFGLIEATLAAIERLLRAHPDLDHVCLLSVACLPIRPPRDLVRFLANNAGRDFIESVSVADENWVEDGLSLERFTLYHPFSHRRHPWWFSRSVDVQRMLRMRRRLPVGVVPHLGSQWWCLSVPTLRAILDHPDLPRWKRFFRSSWIPDESFFQTLVRTVRPDAKPDPSLHLGRFNRRGRPVVFHDDHVAFLSATDHFFARKIDADATGLYDVFLGAGLPSLGAGFARHVDDDAFNQARAEQEHEGRGILSSSRLPKGVTLSRCDTVRPYLAIIAKDAKLLETLLPRLRAEASDCIVHGRLFRADKPTDFANSSLIYKGNINGQAEQWTYRPAQFLSRLIWADRDKPMVFLIGPGDEARIRFQLATDPNARLVVLDKAAAAEKKVTALSDPFGGRDKASRSRLPLRAWHRSLDPDEVWGVSGGQPEDALNLAGLMSSIQSDWFLPEGWKNSE